MKDLLIFFIVFYVLKIVLRALWGGFKASDYRRDRWKKQDDNQCPGYCVRSVDVHVYVDYVSVIMKMKRKKGSASHDEEPSIDEFMN